MLQVGICVGPDGFQLRTFSLRKTQELRAVSEQCRFPIDLNIFTGSACTNSSLHRGSVQEGRGARVIERVQRNKKLEPAMVEEARRA